MQACDVSAAADIMRTWCDYPYRQPKGKLAVAGSQRAAIAGLCVVPSVYAEYCAMVSITTLSIRLSLCGSAPKQPTVPFAVRLWPASQGCWLACGRERIGGYHVGSSGCVCGWGVPSHSYVIYFTWGPIAIICDIIFCDVNNYATCLHKYLRTTLAACCFAVCLLRRTCYETKAKDCI